MTDYAVIFDMDGVLVDRAVWALYFTWSKNLERWKKTGSDRRYHYLGSAIWYNRIGKATLDLMNKK